jgi:transcriptional regulator with XRE-family HTH domain
VPTPVGDAAAEFGRRVRVARAERGLSQMGLAEACGLHFTFVSSVERGQRNLALSNILKLAAGLQVDAGQLVSGLPPD